RSGSQPSGQTAWCPLGCKLAGWLARASLRDAQRLVPLAFGECEERTPVVHRLWDSHAIQRARMEAGEQPAAEVCGGGQGGRGVAGLAIAADDRAAVVATPLEHDAPRERAAVAAADAVVVQVGQDRGVADQRAIDG